MLWEVIALDLAKADTLMINESAWLQQICMHLYFYVVFKHVKSV